MCCVRRYGVFICNTFFPQQFVAVDFTSDAMIAGRMIVPRCDVSAIPAIVCALLFYLLLFIFCPLLNRGSVSERIISRQRIWRMHVVLQVHQFCTVECGYFKIYANVNKWNTIYVPEQHAGYLKNINYFVNPCFAVESEGTTGLLNVGDNSPHCSVPYPWRPKFVLTKFVEQELTILRTAQKSLDTRYLSCCL
jgi:hypothetical protein